MFNLSAKVKEQFTESIARLSSANLQKHHKVLAFKDSIKNALNQGNACAEEILWNILNLCPSAVHSGLITHPEGGQRFVSPPVAMMMMSLLTLLHPAFKGSQEHRHQGKYLLHQGTLLILTKVALWETTYVRHQHITWGHFRHSVCYVGLYYGA